MGPEYRSMAIMPPKPLVSVIMAAHNTEKYIAEAIESVQAQTYTNWELIITDDASTDATRDIIHRYMAHDSRIRIIPLSTLVRQTIARIKAIELAAGSYLAILDADDVALPERLETQITFLGSHPAMALVGSDAELIDEHGRHTGNKVKPRDLAEIRFKLLLQTQFVHSSVCMRKAAYDAVGGYDGETYRLYAEEYDLWNRLVNAGYAVTNIPHILVKYRVHPKSISINDTSGVQSERAFHVNEKNIRRYLPQITRDEVMLLSNLVNRPGLSVSQILAGLALYRKLALAYIAYHRLGADESNTVRRIYQDRKWHLLKTAAKSLLRGH